MTTPSPPPIAPETNLGPTRWGMISFLASEVAFFATLIVTYLIFLGKDKVGPTPAEALSRSVRGRDHPCRGGQH